MQTTIARGSLPGRRGVREIALIGALYVFYCMTRTLADGALGPAQDRAGDLLTMERVLHAGWALWVALVVRRSTRRSWARGLAWTHAVITAVVVIGTGNHWLLDLAVGWALVIVAMWLVDPWFADSRELVNERRIQFHQRI